MGRWICCGQVEIFFYQLQENKSHFQPWVSKAIMAHRCKSKGRSEVITLKRNIYPPPPLQECVCAIWKKSPHGFPRYASETKMRQPAGVQTDVGMIKISHYHDSFWHMRLEFTAEFIQCILVVAAYFSLFCWCQEKTCFLFFLQSTLKTVIIFNIFSHPNKI